MKTADALALIAQRLAAAGIEDARREARIILAATLGTDAAGLLMVESVAPAQFQTMLVRREAREPLAYILGRREFWGLNFETSPATLIPRPDSESLIEAACAAFPERAVVRKILDLGTGTGCLLLAALTEFPSAFGIGVDISPAAAALAARNAQTLGLASRAAFLAGDWAAPLAGPFDLILSNPPYIPHADLAGLMPEVRDHEPITALNGGADGFDAYGTILIALPALLAPSGAAVLELGAGQAQIFICLARSAGFHVATRADLTGHQRAAIVTRPARQG
jgi:release factor glutamine methyltransferase